MSNTKVIVSESILEDIGKNIRIKLNSEDQIKTKNFPENIYNIPNAGLTSFTGLHTNKLGIWEKPDEWDDIESIDISDKHECYLLCSKLVNTTPFVSLTVEAHGNVYWSYGHVIDGEFIISDSSTRTKLNLNSSNKASFNLYLGDLADDYIVIKIESDTDLVNVTPTSYTNRAISSHNFGAIYNAVLMRYGRYVKGTILGFRTYYFESDYLIDFAIDHQNSNVNITCSSAYTAIYNFQRLRLVGSDLSKNNITSFELMFSACYALADLGDTFDMTGWVTDSCTSLKNMFNACFSMKSKLIVKDWDIKNVATMSGIFNNMYSVTNIDGFETWTKAEKCSEFKNMFSNCYSLTGTIDLSSLYMGNAGTALTGDVVTAMFVYTRSINKINLNNANFSGVTILTNFFQYSACRELIWNNFIPPGNSLQLLNSSFASVTGFDELIFDGWDFSGITNMGNCFNNAYGIKKLVFRNCTPPITIVDTASTTVPFTYLTNCTYLDLSDFDLSKCTGTYWHAGLINSSPNLVEFFPPQHICKETNFNSSAMLSKASLLRILNNLDTVSTSTKLSIGATNLGKLTDDEIAIATNKGWTLA